MVSWICVTSARLAFAGDEPEARREMGEDVGGLRHDGAVDAHERRRERKRARLLALEEAHHAGHAALRAGDVDVVGARVLQQEPDELAAALNRRPVVELEGHARPDTTRYAGREVAPSGQPDDVRVSS